MTKRSGLAVTRGAAKPRPSFQHSQRGFENLDPDVIEIGERLRPLDPAVVDGLVASIKQASLLQPPLVRKIADKDQAHSHPRYALICGHHRLLAVRELKKQDGHAFGRVRFAVMTCSDDESLLMELDENLQHNPLNDQQRREFLAMRVRLTNKVRHGDAPCSGGKQPRNQSIRATARTLNLPEATVRRAVRAENLAPKAKDAATEAGLGTAARARIAGRAPTAAQQLAAIREATEQRTEQKRQRRILKSKLVNAEAPSANAGSESGAMPSALTASQGSSPPATGAGHQRVKCRAAPRQPTPTRDQAQQIWREASDSARLEAGLRLIKQASPKMLARLVEQLNPGCAQAAAERMNVCQAAFRDDRQQVLPFERGGLKNSDSAISGYSRPPRPDGCREERGA